MIRPLKIIENIFSYFGRALGVDMPRARNSISIEKERSLSLFTIDSIHSITAIISLNNAT